MAEKADIERMLAECTGEMAYRLFLEREPAFGNAFEMGRQMVAMGHSPDEIVDSILADLSPKNHQYAIDNPHVRTLLVRATEYAAARLDNKLHTAPLN